MVERVMVVIGLKGVADQLQPDLAPQLLVERAREPGRHQRLGDLPAALGGDSATSAS
jgi:hypothetical protein